METASIRLNARIAYKWGNDALARCLSHHKETGSCCFYRVLLYHSVGKIDPKDDLYIRVSNKAFEEQMSFLYSEGYNVIALKDIFGGSGNPQSTKKTVVITFDDGYKDNMEEAVPIMSRFNFRATVLVTAASIGGIKTKRQWQKWKYLSSRDICSMDSEGYDVGSHSLTHRNLKRLKPDEAMGEMVKSKKILEDVVGHGIQGFSFPYGLYNKDLLDMAGRAGYQFACTTVCGLNDTSDRGMLGIKRTEINGFDDLSRFRMKLNGDYDWLGLFGLGV